MIEDNKFCNKSVDINIVEVDEDNIKPVGNLEFLKNNLKKSSKRSLRYALVYNTISDSCKRFEETYHNFSRAISASASDSERHTILKRIDDYGLEVMHSGVYNWLKIFGGEFLINRSTFNDELEYYDILHVNLQTLTVDMCKHLRESIGWNSNTKIIITPDYPVENIMNHDPGCMYHIGREAAEYADLVMCTNENIYQIYSWLLGSDKVCKCEHPCDVQGMRNLILNGRKYLELEELSVAENKINPNHPGYPIVLVNTHKWDRSHRGMPDIYTPYVALNPNHKNRLRCIAHVSNIPKETQAITEATKLYNYYFLEGLSMKQLWKFMSTCWSIIDMYKASSFGRFTTESASLGIPTICNKDTDSARRCFPELATDIARPDLIHKYMKRLLNDPGYRMKLAKSASNKVEFYNYRNSKKRFLSMLESANLLPKEVFGTKDLQ